MKVKIYRNLHKNIFSVVDQATGRVAFYATSFLLADAQFRVQEGGRQRVLREKTKNVHAYVLGTLLGFRGEDREGFPIWIPHRGLSVRVPSDGRTPFREGFDDVSYNPYKAGDFVSNGQPVKAAEEVVGFATGKIQATGISK